MRKKQLKGLYRVRSKGRTYFYLKIKNTIISKLPDVSDPTFQTAYEAALKSEPKGTSIEPRTVKWVCVKYLASLEFRKLSPKTQDSYKREIRRMESIFNLPVSKVSRQTIRLIRSNLESKSRTQQLFTQVSSVVFNFAMRELDLITVNPAAGFKRLNKGQSYRRWTEEDMQIFEASSPPSELLTAYMICRYAGVRRGDLVKLRRSDWDGRFLSIGGHKTNNPVVVPALGRLQEYLNALPLTLTLVADRRGRPIEPMSLSKRLKRHADKIGLKELHLHGLRHEAANALSEAGCTPSEIQSVLGHKTLQMVQKYTSQRDQKKMAAQAIEKLEKQGK